jgi:[ribosomal protein S5]-alanine N-acetyltransferase
MTSFALAAFSAPLHVPELTNGSALLRPFAVSDLPLLRAAADDPYIPAITSVPAVYSDDSGRGFIERQQTLALEGHGYSFVIADATDPHQGRGAIGLWLREIDSGRASIGYWVAPTARRHHRATEALCTVTTFAFDELAIPRLHLFIEPWNVASQRTAAAAGFTREALLRGWERIGGTQHDAYCYALLRPVGGQG